MKGARERRNLAFPPRTSRAAESPRGARHAFRPSGKRRERSVTKIDPVRRGSGPKNSKYTRRGAMDKTAPLKYNMGNDEQGIARARRWKKNPIHGQSNGYFRAAQRRSLALPPADIVLWIPSVTRCTVVRRRRIVSEGDSVLFSGQLLPGGVCLGALRVIVKPAISVG